MPASRVQHPHNPCPLGRGQGSGIHQQEVGEGSHPRVGSAKENQRLRYLLRGEQE